MTSLAANSMTNRRLKEVADLSLGKMLDDKKNLGQPRPYLANVNVRWGEFDLVDLRAMRFEESELVRFGVEPGDILMCEGGEPGRCAVWKGQLPGMTFQKALHRIRSRGEVDQKYLFYRLYQLGRSGGFSPYLTGSTIKHLPKEKLELVEVTYPDLTVQKTIASLLSAYDDLIENNRRRIAILEALARNLYQEWFVRLRFPGWETTKIVDGVPDGWNRSSLGSITTKIGSGATPRGGEAAYQSTGIALIRSLNVYNDRFELAGLARISDQQASELQNVRVEKGDILLNITGASVARCCLVPEHVLPARVNQHVMIIRVNDRTPASFVIAAINDPETKRRLLSLSQGGATREALTKDLVGSFEILIPDQELLDRYHAISGPLLQQRETLESTNQTLSRARDLLLPRLMSGELEV